MEQEFQKKERELQEEKEKVCQEQQKVKEEQQRLRQEQERVRQLEADKEASAREGLGEDSSLQVILVKLIASIRPGLFFRSNVLCQIYKKNYTRHGGMRQ